MADKAVDKVADVAEAAKAADNMAEKKAKSGADAYARAGVDISAGERLVQRIAPLAAATQEGLRGGARLLGGIGGFAAAMALPAGMRQPVLFAAADGVGTKLELARRERAPACIGTDVVAMCVNDLLCAGAQPLFFLDYIACGKLDEDFTAAVIAGIADACRESGCALIGGETAEMPGVYPPEGFDIAGFAVGVGEEDDLLTPCGARGDALVALASSGAHSNGYSLIRRLLAEQPALARQSVEGVPLLQALLTPTRLYCRAIARLREAVPLRGLAHITGGGITENLPRALPPGVTAALDFSALPLPPLFALLQQAGDVGDDDMRRIFNCGVGMIAVVAEDDAEAAVRLLNESGERAWRIGSLQ